MADQTTKYEITLDDFTCPISLNLFLDPVIFESSLYERDEIIKWLQKHNTCPMTNLPIKNKNITECVPVKNIIDSLVIKYPELNNNRYKSHNMGAVVSIILSGKCDKLFDYESFDLEHLMMTKFDNTDTKVKCAVLTKLVMMGCENVLKYVIDNAINLEVNNGRANWRLINYILRSSTPTICSYLIGKGVDLEFADNEEWRPIHYACRFQSMSIIKLIVDSGVNIEAEDNEHWRPIHYVCHSNTLETIKFIISKGAELNHRVKKRSGSECNLGIFELTAFNNKLSVNDKNELQELLSKPKTNDIQQINEKQIDQQINEKQIDQQIDRIATQINTITIEQQIDRILNDQSDKSAIQPTSHFKKFISKIFDTKQ